MSEEARVEGNVSRHIYLKYFTAGCNVLFLMVILLLSIIAEVSHHSHSNIFWLLYIDFSKIMCAVRSCKLVLDLLYIFVYLK